MKNKRVVIIAALTVTILVGAGTVAGAMYRDKDIVLSKNVAKDIQAEESEINSFIEEGKTFLEGKKYDEAKASFEKAIAKEVTRFESYTKIIDLYKEKNRYDDAYYFAKLIKGNNLDITNYDEIVNSIKSNLKLATVKADIFVKNGYEYPNEVTIDINNEPTKVEVEWDNKNTDLSKEGVYVVNGKVKKYDRDVELTINVRGVMTKEEGAEILHQCILSKDKLKVYFKFSRELKYQNKIFYIYEKDTSKQNDEYYTGDTKPALDYATGDQYSWNIAGELRDINGNSLGFTGGSADEENRDKVLQARKGYSAVQAVKRVFWKITDSDVRQIYIDDEPYGSGNFKMKFSYELGECIYNCKITEISIDSASNLINNEYKGARAAVVTAEAYGNTSEYLFILNEDNTKAKIYRKYANDKSYVFFGNTEYIL